MGFTQEGPEVYPGMQQLLLKEMILHYNVIKCSD